MGVGRPTGHYAEQMLDPDGWTDADETLFYDRAQHFTQVLRQVTDALEVCRRQETQIFDGGVWSGGAAAAAHRELGADIDRLTTLQSGLSTVVEWHNHIADRIVQAKSTIYDTVDVAQSQIRALARDISLDADERTASINALVSRAYRVNVRVIAHTAEQISATKTWQPEAPAMPSPSVPPSDHPITPAPGSNDPDPETPDPGTLDPETPGPEKPGWGMPGAGTPGSGMPGPGMPGSGVPGSGIRRPWMPHAPVSQPEAPAGPTVPLGPDAPGDVPSTPLSPAASTAQPSAVGGRGRGLAPTSVMSPSSVSAPSDESPPPVAPAAGPPPTPVPPTVPAGAAAGPGAGSSSPVGRQSAAKASGGRPAPVTKPAAGSRRVDRPEEAGTQASDSSVPPPPVPVSGARAVRDAIAAADAARSRSEPDYLGLAVRVAAALNAPDSAGARDFKFSWLTAATTDGAIVVANSYGLAYLPDGVHLPESVQLATADEAVPATERARWATYPLLALQGWAAHHGSELRAVIGTAKQLAKLGSSVPTVALKPDDIPDTGKMTGRSRLGVVDPGAADRLAATEDSRLVDILPPPPAAATPPTDQRPALWYQVMKPLASGKSTRIGTHLRAFHTYAAHAQEIALAAAYSAGDAATQRDAAADWLYWKYLTGLLDAADDAVPVPS